MLTLELRVSVVVPQVLSDEEKRRMYDVTGHSEYTQAAGGGGAGGGAPFTTMRAEEIFRQFFGGDFSGLGSIFGGGADFGMGNQQVLQHTSLYTCST